MESALPVVCVVEHKSKIIGNLPNSEFRCSKLVYGFVAVDAKRTGKINIRTLLCLRDHPTNYVHSTLCSQLLWPQRWIADVQSLLQAMVLAPQIQLYSVDAADKVLKSDMVVTNFCDLAEQTVKL